ncbi:NADPH-dependent ferric siderophore reductase, contains FAD-binding and SIP domains [Marinactinospora thermotolerans DSM 45154]|uniref:NADPH-dependent ferric siderophore reductase, contains FAD-binding and SIP domains n=1 Tax=Marinactinospora thermotolerans DSM 45154 TaxID=1122192 RepID=A0A1T4TD12_9ACTN|nr:siderophore-interacting protein [Marinactinospora thermotolerans]SKA38430.1 NADPH-dependent ferric siderophore reductase, contains FAD-binding and SIP domains [Marinactinospora thermotolerans DSM 45154]
MALAQREIRVEMYPLAPRVLEVRSARRITPRMIRVVLGGADLADFRSDNFADHVKLWFPDERTGEHVMPVVENDRALNFRAPGALYRDYTVRRHDPAARELTVDFVAHDHGPAGRWALRAEPGLRLGVLGPRGTEHVPADYDYHVLVADETALPAAARRLEELPEGARVHAFFEVADAAEESYVEAREGVSITWLHRGDAAPGDSGLLERAVRGFDFPEGEGFVWVAGEATALRPIRRHLKELGFVKDRTMAVDGYWRRGTANLDHHAADDE